MRTAAILPVKRFARAKSRLAASIADPLRRELASAMVADVLLALAQCSSIERTIVVSCEQSLLETAHGLGVLVVSDADEDGQSAAVALGVGRARSEGIERVLCIPGDCPALDPTELDRLLAAGAGVDPACRPEVVIVPDRHGTGTNGLLLTPPDAIAPSFGPDSCERHRAAALAAGVAWRLEHPSSLLLDIDTGADISALRERLARAPGRASRTRAVLGQPDQRQSFSIANAG